MSKPLKAFIVYSHQDIEAKEKLIQRLSVMKSEGLINIWSDNQIHPGDKWKEVVFKNIADSDILLYLVSTSSLTSESCYMELVRSLNTTIVWTILSCQDFRSGVKYGLSTLLHL